MAFQQKPDSGTLFGNTRRTKEAQPNSTGTALIGGVVYRVAGWTKMMKSGEKYLSRRFTPANQVQQYRQPPKSPVTNAECDSAPSAPRDMQSTEDPQTDCPF